MGGLGGVLGGGGEEKWERIDLLLKHNSISSLPLPFHLLPQKIPIIVPYCSLISTPTKQVSVPSVHWSHFVNTSECCLAFLTPPGGRLLCLTQVCSIVWFLPAATADGDAFHGDVQVRDVQRRARCRRAAVRVGRERGHAVRRNQPRHVWRGPVHQVLCRLSCP